MVLVRPKPARFASAASGNVQAGLKRGCELDLMRLVPCAESDLLNGGAREDQITDVRRHNQFQLTSPKKI